MIGSTDLLYKLMVLYMLNRVSFPLTKAQISDFMLEKEYTNFLTLQTVFAELTADSFVTEETIRNRTLLTITEEGRQSLSFFGSRIGSSIKQDIEDYLAANKLRMRSETSVQGNYYQTATNEFVAELTAKEKETTIVSLTLTVPTEEMAEDVCNNWQTKNEEIYRYLTGSLFGK